MNHECSLCGNDYNDDEPSRTITFCLDSPERNIVVACDEDNTIDQVVNHFRSFLLALGFLESQVDEVINPGVQDWAYFGRPDETAKDTCGKGNAGCSSSPSNLGNITTTQAASTKGYRSTFKDSYRR